MLSGFNVYNLRNRREKGVFHLSGRHIYRDLLICRDHTRKYPAGDL